MTWMHAALRKPGPGESANLAEVVAPLRPGVLRFGGGLWANSTGWDRSNSVQEWSTQVPWRWTNAAGAQFSYSYTHVYNAQMVDSLGAFARGLGAEVMVQANVCDNNPAMWADLVRYANVEHGYQFQYWELGNELSLGDNWKCLGSKNEKDAAQEYARRFVAYRQAMTAVDPAIKLVGPATHQPSDNGRWIPPLLAAVAATGKPVDVVSWHRYPLEGSLSLSAVDDGLLDIQSRQGMVDSVLADVRRTLSGARIPGAQTAVTEINTHVSDTAPINAGHLGALWMLDILPRAAYNGLDMDVWYNLYDDTDFGLIASDGSNEPTALSVRPTYYGMLMLSQYFGDTLVESKTGDPRQRVVVWASRDSKDPSTLKLLLLNLRGKSVKATIAVSGFTPAGGSAYVMASTDPTSLAKSSINGGTTINGASIATAAGKVQPSVAAIPPRSIEGISGQAVAYDLPPYSAAALVLTGTAG